MVAREVEHDRVGPGAHDLLEELGVGAVEAVDGLVRVADAEEIGIVARHLTQQRELQRVHVLGLVDVERLRVVSKRREDVRLVGQERDRLGEQEVEVEDAARAAQSDVAVEHLGELRRRQRRVAPQLAGALGVVRAVEALGERPADLLFDARELPLLELQVAAVAQLHGEGGDQTSAARFERERLEVVVLAVLRDDVERHLVERARAHVADPGAKESLAQFVAGLAREGHRQDLIGAHLFVGDATLDAQSEYVRLARAGRRANEQTARRAT